MKKLSLSLAKKLFKLLREKSINGSEFRNPDTLQALVDHGIVHLQVKGQKRKVILLSAKKLNVHLQLIYGIESLEAYIEQGLDPKRTRAGLAQVSNSTKVFRTGVQAGLYLASYEPVDIYVNGETISLHTPNMTSLFVHKNARLSLDNDIVIVGVENFENLTSISKQRKLFVDPSKKVFIYRNKYLRSFLSTSLNDYIHYGDFDLAGVHIYLNEIIPRLSHERHSFFIPEKISELLEHGSSADYFSHLKKYPNLKSEIAYIQAFIDLLHEKKRSLHQEFMIER